MANKTGGDVFEENEAEKLLFPANGLPGGGQLEVRMEISPDHPDPDVRGVARRSNFSISKVGTKNGLKSQRKTKSWRRVSNRKNAIKPPMSFTSAPPIFTAAPWFTWPRAIRACCRLSKNSKRILTKPGAWSTPPFERVEISYEGHKLPALFWPGRGKPGEKLPVVYNYGGADGILLRGEDGGAGQYVRRGMSFIDVDGPGHGGTLRHHKLYAPPDSERVAKAVIDYLVTRADVDAERIGLHGSSMGGYSGPRCATVEKRIKAVAVWSGAYNLVDDIFDYYPPIQERLRWLMGAKDLKDAREKIKEFTLIGRANKIECPLLSATASMTASWTRAAR